MNWMYWLSGVLALALFAYLVVALFRPELFS
jgi:K+-transporting ATPase KdpF subunit